MLGQWTTDILPAMVVTSVDSACHAGAQAIVVWSLQRAFPNTPMQMVAEEDSADLRCASIRCMASNWPFMLLCTRNFIWCCSYSSRRMSQICTAKRNTRFKIHARSMCRSEGGGAMTKRITQLVNSTLEGETNNEETLTEDQVCIT